MRKFATIFKIDPNERDNLLRELASAGFRVLDPIHIVRSIYHSSMPQGMIVGRLDEYFSDYNLHVYEIDGGNPLNEFVEKYRSKTLEAATS